MTKKEGVKRLWTKVFSSDSKEFVSMYFEKVYRDENTFVKEVDNKVVSAVQLIPYLMTYYGSVIKVGYVSGASTYPCFEGRHMMTSLMYEAINAGFQRGDTLMTLIPANYGLIDFYKRFGFAVIFQKNDVVFHSSGNHDGRSIIRIKKDDAAQAYTYFNRKMSERNNCIQHSYDDFVNICADEDMMVFALEQHTTIVAMAYCLVTCQSPVVKELLYDSDESKRKLLEGICSIFNLPQITYRDYNTALQGGDYGMGRVIDVKNLLTVFAANNKDMSVVLRVTDEILDANNYFYKIDSGKVEILKEYDRNDYRDMKIENLMNYIKRHNAETSPGEPFYMSLMLE